MTTTITIAGAKGGTGKTTTTLALGYELARAGHRVVIVDADPQASATQGMEQQASDRPLSEQPVQLELDFSRPAVDETAANPGSVRLLRGGRPMASASRADVSALIDRTSGDADILLIDTIPTIGPITIAALTAADLIVVPLQPAPFPLSGLMDTISITRQVNPQACTRALLTMVKARRSLTQIIASQIEEQMPGLLFQARIPDDARCEWASLACEPIGSFDPRSRAASAYRMLAHEILIQLEMTVPDATQPCGSCAGEISSLNPVIANGAR